MNGIRELLSSIDELQTSGAEALEESFRLIIKGENLTEVQEHAIRVVMERLESVMPDCSPILQFDEDSSQVDDFLDGSSMLGSSWSIVLPKSPFAAQWRAGDERQILFFFSEMGLFNWLESLNPFVKSSSFDPDFDKPVTIRVLGLNKAFGGPSLCVLPLEDSPPELTTSQMPLPSSADVHAIVHATSSGPNVQISPNGWALTWGALESKAAQPLLRLGCLVLAASLTNEIRYGDTGVSVKIRGAKQYSLNLWDTNVSLRWAELHKRLVRAVAWVYSERPETRLKLLMDRLTLDLNHGECLLACLYRHLDFALGQAEDSYNFVILDRKDAYYKEMREIMKDMKAQSDYYATKTRDMIGALSRDFLGVLVFLAFSFIGKFDPTKLEGLLSSQELTIFLRFLAGYLTISFFLQLTSLIRDDDLTNRESLRWLEVLRNYTSSQDSIDYFLRPLASRRRTLHHAMYISGILYGSLAITVWHLPKIVHFLLS